MRPAKSLLWQYAGHAVDALVGVTLIAYVTRQISVPDYGVLALALGIAGFLVLVCDLGVSAVVIREYITREARASADEASRLFSAAFLVSMVTAAIGFGCCVGLTFLLPEPFRLSAGQTLLARSMLPVVGLYVACKLVASTFESAHLARRRFESINRAQIVSALLRATMTVAALAQGRGVVALAQVQVGAELARMMWLIAEFQRLEDRPRLRLRGLDWSGFHRVTRDARWSLFDNVGRNLSMTADSAILGILGSVDAVAVYTIGNRVPLQIWRLVSRGVGVAHLAMATEHAQDDLHSVQRTFVLACRASVLIVLPVLVTLAAGSDVLIGYWVGPGYASASTVMRLLLLASVAQAVNAVCYAAFYAVGHVATAARISLAEGAVNLLLSVALVPRFGGVGLAAATAIAHLAGTFGWYLPAACAALDLKPKAVLAPIAREAIVPMIAMGGVLVLVPVITAGSPSLVRTVLVLIGSGLCYWVTWYVAASRSRRGVHLIRFW